MSSFLLGIVCMIFAFLALYLHRELKKRKHTEKLLDESEERFRMLFEVVPIFIDKFDAHGKCVLWNKECERVFGWNIDEINAHEDSIALFHPDEESQTFMRHAFIDKRETFFIEMHPRAKSGEKIYSQWANVNLPNGEIIYIGIDIRAQRISESKLLHAQQALKESNDSLEKRVALAIEEIQSKEKLLLQQSRLAQMGEMISMIAHQWRQPLSVIDMTAFAIQSKLDREVFDCDDVLMRRVFTDYLRKELVDIQTFTQYLSETIEDFTNFFMPGKEKEHTVFNAPIKKALTILEPLIKREMVRIIESNHTVNKLFIYTHEIMQVVLNILKNSIDNFSEKTVESPTIHINTYETATAFVMEIADNGGGISASILPQIFDPYFSTKSDKNGTGLGLYMSKVLIEYHSDGTLDVQNRDNGVCFTITLDKEVPHE